MRRIYGVTRTDIDDDDDDNDDIQSKLAASKSPKLQPDILSPDNSQAYLCHVADNKGLQLPDIN